MDYLKILKAGLLTTVQDYGRYGYQKYGVTPSGAMDVESMEIANLITGNKKDEAVLEMTYVGDEILFKVNTVIAITGADMNPLLNNKSLDMYERTNINKGDILKFSYAKNGLRTYLSVYGGFKINKVMNSKSTYTKFSIGGYEGRKLKKGDTLYVNEVNVRSDKIEDINIQKKIKKPEYIRVIEGPDFDSFNEKSKKDFFENEYEIKDQSDRMGYRLIGEKIFHKEGPDIISRGLPIGAIQVSGDNQPIIMLSDRQTIGGYTVIGVVVTVDINKLAQMKPGDKLRFNRISLKSAQKLIKNHKDTINKLENYLIDKKIYKVHDIKNFEIKVNGENFNVSVVEK